ncbi:MAG: YcxB family protein [Calditrichia bacterium]
MITTHPTRLSQQSLFRLHIANYIKRRKWYWVALFALAAFHATSDSYGPLEIFFIGFPFIYFLLLIWAFWRHAYSDENKAMLLERYYEISTDKINYIIDQETQSTIKLEHFVKVQFTQDIYQLYLTKHQFLYIPTDLFKSASDRQWFEKEIVSRVSA